MIDWDKAPLRTLLFAPANDERKLRKVGTVGADVVILDLEDAVAASEKAAARESVGLAVPGIEAEVVCVRVNCEASGLLELDVTASVLEGMHGLLVPKVEDAATLGRLDKLVRKLERRSRLAKGSIGFFALIETARGLARCEEIAESGSPRLVTFVFGLADFSTDIGLDLSVEGTELLYARSRLVVAARAAGLRAPVDGPYLQLEDAAGLVSDSVRSRRLGFQGRVLIHPSQVEPVRNAYSGMAPAELMQVQRLVEAFEQAEAKGVASIRVAGQFVDYPIYERAREKLRAHDALRAR